MESVWSRESNISSFPNLMGNMETDVVIVGGGIAGILTAYMLQNSGVDYVLLEKGQILKGVTANTTAKITCQHGFVFDKLINEFDEEFARLYLKSNLQALNEYKKLCENIDCDFEIRDNYVYSLNDMEKVDKEAAALIKIGYPAEIDKTLPLDFSVAGAIKFKNQAEFNPLKFLSAISKGLNIYENALVTDIKGNMVYTNLGNVKGKRIVVATHFPIVNRHGSYFLKMYQHRSYVVGLLNGKKVNGMYVDEAMNGMSFRNYKDYLLIGGGDHRTGKKGGGYDELIAFAKEHYPKSPVAFKWATQDCITLDGVPYVGKYSKNTENMYVITGFNKWGMTSAMAGAKLLADLITGKENEYEKVFSPSRTVLRPTLCTNIAEATLSLLTPTTKRCTHLGCALKWNKAEHSWDCPCHGSRYDDRGKVIEAPAIKNIK